MITQTENLSQPSPLENFPAMPRQSGASAFSSGRLMVVGAVLAAALVFLVGAGMDWFVLHENESRTVAISLSDSLAAVIAGILVYRLLKYERERRAQLRQRLEIIAEMNHHVRNALQVISLSNYSADSEQQLERIREGVNRIQWALKEILPKM
jgi:signal transduction histidine kinase